MFLEKITPATFSMIVIAIFAILFFLLRDRLRDYSPNKLKRWQSVLLFLSPILAVVIFAVVRYLVVFEPRFDLFEVHMSEYTSVANQQPGAWYVHGKVLPIEMRTNTVEIQTYYELPGNLRATTPEDVGTVLWLDCTTRAVGTYTSGGAARQWFCDVTLIDLSIPAIIGETSFAGSEPPRTTTKSSGETGSFPAKEIVDYLESLPRN